MYLSYPFGADMLSVMSVAARACNEAAMSEIFRAVEMKTGGFKASAEWRQVLVRPLHMLHCST
jgi:hypothetical protein